MVGLNQPTNKQAYTHMHAQCSHASVGLAQARPNYNIALYQGHFKLYLWGVGQALKNCVKKL